MMRGQRPDRGRAVAAAVVHDHDRPGVDVVEHRAGDPLGGRAARPVARVDRPQHQPHAQARGDRDDPVRPAAARRAEQGRVHPSVASGLQGAVDLEADRARALLAERRCERMRPRVILDLDPVLAVLRGDQLGEVLGEVADDEEGRRGVQAAQDREDPARLARPGAVVERERDGLRDDGRAGGVERGRRHLARDAGPSRSPARRARGRGSTPGRPAGPREPARAARSRARCGRGRARAVRRSPSRSGGAAAAGMPFTVHAAGVDARPQRHAGDVHQVARARPQPEVAHRVGESRSGHHRAGRSVDRHLHGRRLVGDRRREPADARAAPRAPRRAERRCDRSVPPLHGALPGSPANASRVSPV